MDFLKKISDVFKNLLPSKKNEDNINVPPAPPTHEQPSGETVPESEESPIKQNFNASGEEQKGL
jgi:predicted ATP-dependent protease